MFAVAVGSAVSAFMLLFGSIDDSDVPSGLAKLFGIVAIVLTLVFGSIAVAVWSGNSEGRNAAAAVAGLMGANGVAVMLDSDSDSIGAGIVVLVIAAVMAGLLWTPSARAYYD